MGQLPPLNVSVKEAARILGVSIWTVRQRCNAGLIKSTYEGERRLVNYRSLCDYAASLPTSRRDEVGL